MKTRKILPKEDTTLSLIDAYGYIRFEAQIEANKPLSIPLPLKREHYTDKEGKIYYIYEGKGVLDDFDFALKAFVLEKNIIKDFDRFLFSSECEEKNKEVFEQIMAILDANLIKPDFIIEPSITQLESGILELAGVDYAK